MLILLFLYFLQIEGYAFPQKRNDVYHKYDYDTSRMFVPNNIRTGYTEMDYNVRARYPGIDNNIGLSYNKIDNSLVKEDFTEVENNMGTNYAGMEKTKPSLDDLLNEFYTLVTVKENTLFTDVLELVEYLKIRLPTRLSEVMGLIRGIYVLIREALAVFLENLPEELFIVNYLFKLISSVFSGRLIEDITKQLAAYQGLYSIPQKMLSRISAEGAFSNDMLGSFGEPLLEIVTKLNTWAVEVLENITPLLHFEELADILESGSNKTSANRTSESPGDMFEAYQNTLKLYPKLDELTTGTDHYHLSKSLFKVMTRLLKLIYAHN